MGTGAIGDGAALATGGGCVAACGGGIGLVPVAFMIASVRRERASGAGADGAADA
jgi:hypothetical protein